MHMFSNIKIRIQTAIINNPPLFKHITLYLDGHDTRATYINKDKTSYYSYKLKKTGFRTQVCADINNMILFVSKSAPCSSNSDGTMLSKMKIENKIHNLDCIALDGGYTLFLNDIINDDNDLKINNFNYPIRKQKHIELTDEEKRYNEMFGSFRSKIESKFAEIGNTFERFNNKKSIRTNDMDTFNLQFKIGCLLFNIKNFVKLGGIIHESYQAF